MAKRKQIHPESKYIRYTSKSGDKSLLLTDNFIYQVELFKFEPNSFNLQDSTYIESAAYVDDRTDTNRLGHTVFKTEIKLIGAPLLWLAENGYKED